MDKMQKAMAMIQQGMSLLQEVMAPNKKMADAEMDDDMEDMEEDTEAIFPMDASDKSDKKGIVISMMKKKGL